MTDTELIATLRRNMVETGSLLCLGCGHAHGCSTHGCAIMRAAADPIPELIAENRTIREGSASHEVYAAEAAERDALKRRLDAVIGNVLDIALEGE